MDKINFEDGQLVKQASVTIDGVEHQVTPSQYSGKTPLSAYVFNQMQDNIENGINQQATQQNQKNAEQDTAIANKIDKTTETASDLNDITDECTVYCTSTTANKPLSINRMV